MDKQSPWKLLLHGEHLFLINDERNMSQTAVHLFTCVLYPSPSFHFISPPTIWIRLFICSLLGYRVSLWFSRFPMNLSLLQYIQWASFTIAYTLKPFSRFSISSRSLPAMLLYSYISSIWCTHFSLWPLPKLHFPNNPGFILRFFLTLVFLAWITFSLFCLKKYYFYLL